MKILHYALGFPPYRTGGLTKYCTDLMLTQKNKDEVSLLWPGQIELLGNLPVIRQKKSFQGIKSFELYNPLPVPLYGGVNKIEDFIAPCDKTVYKRFLQMLKPDVIHVHTLMGLHREFFQTACELKIRTVFTSHDYYGLCPKVTFFKSGDVCKNDHNCRDCVICNQSALGLLKIQLIQSDIYRLLKNTFLIKLIRKYQRNIFFEENITPKPDEKIVTLNAPEYKKLREYYISILEHVSVIHYNSHVAKYIYERFVRNDSNEVIPITHRDIKDQRKIKSYEHEKVKMTFLGPARTFKGVNYLLNLLDELWEKNQKNFELRTYCMISEDKPYIIHRQDGYLYSEMGEIFNQTDVLIVPSQCYETFGFTVLEALSYGVPVLTSERVGAKDLFANLGEHYCIVSKNDLKTNIYNVIQDKRILVELNKEIVQARGDCLFPSIEAVEKLYRSNIQ